MCPLQRGRIRRLGYGFGEEVTDVEEDELAGRALFLL
jgi:hypothetical protein